MFVQRVAFGARAAAVVGWCFSFAVPAGAPAAGMFAGAYVATALGGGRRTVLLTAGAPLILVAVANGFGMTVSGRLQLALAVLLVALLLTAVVTALPHAHLRNLHPFAPHGRPAIGAAAALLVWSFAGWEAITHLAAGFRRPARDLPRATAVAVAVVAVAVVSVLYLAVAATSVLVLGPAAGTSDAPLAELLALSIGGTVHVLAAAAAVLLTLGTMNACFAGAARLGAALGRDGALPAWLDRGGGVGAVPRRSLAVVTGLSGLALAATAVADVGPQPRVLLTTGSFVTVYAPGDGRSGRTAAPRQQFYRCALLALVAVAALLVMTGWYLLWPLVITESALCCLRRRRAGTVRSVSATAAAGAPTVQQAPPSRRPAPPPGQAADLNRCRITERVPGGPPSA